MPESSGTHALPGSKAEKNRLPALVQAQNHGPLVVGVWKLLLTHIALKETNIDSIVLK